ncbi:MAG: hypothetical protein WA951_11325 [Leeuwenhoekiella sp.]
MKNSIILFGALCMILQIQAQDLSGYKYIIVPQQFSFQKEPNQYKVNRLAIFLFKKYGFDAYLAGENLPPDANANGCNTLNMEAEAGGFLGTHLTYTLSNCRGEVVYTSPEGKSKIKQYEGAYNEVMREAMTGFEELGYTYSDEIIPITKTEGGTRMASTENITGNEVNASTPEKTVVVSSIPRTTENPEQSTPSNSNSAIDRDVPKTEEATDKASTAVAKVEDTNVSQINFNTYTSTDGSYMLKRTNAGFDFYEGENKIGEARKTSAGSYLVNTSEFVGVGNLQGNTFTVEREIKGVQGLIKMEFTGIDQ